MNNELVSDIPSFLSYLQKRMDFIAQVATSAPSWCMVTSSNELIDHFSKQYSLIRNIIRSHQGFEGGPNFEPLFEKKYDTPKGHAPSLDIPHGQVGVQAFYTILENIVRNTAKYGDVEHLDRIKNRDKRPGDGKLRFTIAVTDRWDDGGKEWSKDFYQVRIVDHLKTQDSPNAKEGVAANLNNFLSETLTDHATGVVNPKNWGIKEIKICAAYLRMVKQDEIDMKFKQWDNGDDKQQPPIIKVSLENIERQDGVSRGNLTYTLYLMRPKKALVVVSPDKALGGMPPPTDEMRDDFRRAGVDFKTLSEFKAEIDQGGNPRYSFLVLPKPAAADEWNWLSTKLNFLPPRVIILDGMKEDIPQGSGQLNRSLAFMKTPTIKSPALLVDQLTEHWVERWWGDFEIFVRWSQYKSTVADKGAPESKEEEEATEEASKWLVFDHNPRADESKLFAKAAYHEALDSDSTTTKLLQTRSGVVEYSEEVSTQMLVRRSRFRIKETAGLSVAIIDERVWLEKGRAATRGVKKYSGKGAKTLLAVWAKRRVFIQDTNRALSSFAEFVTALAPPDRPLFDFIIIHQGIIDGVRDKMTSKEFQNVWLNLRAKARWLVVDSGRGQPEQAREGNLRWVEYSNLAECLIQYAGDKFKLAELLWTLRASSNNEAAK
jgi:hypothetical protein